VSVAPLAVLVPVLAATLLAATSPVSRRQVAGIVGLGAAVATAALCAVTLARVGGETIVVGTSLTDTTPPTHRRTTGRVWSTMTGTSAAHAHRAA